jgi:beta-barrel assembly-enhancing protease
MRIMSFRRRVIACAALAVLATCATAGAQTRIVAPPNKYKPQQDVELGAKAADEVRGQMPLVNDEDVQQFIRRVGHRLEAAIPSRFVQPTFHYTFQVVNASDINAFALPGGPMFVNRGMITAAHDEGEVAGVMAHELSHVVLRHGTAQAGKAKPYELGALAGAIVGAVVGGTAGNVIAQGTQFGLGTAFLRYSREYEKQADILGAQIMAAAGYNPRSMATMFQTIQKEGGSRGPQWLSSHPDPGNRSAYILAEARTLHVAHAAPDTSALHSVQADLNRLPPAPTTEQLMKNAEADAPARGGGTSGSTGTSGRLSANVPAPSARFRSYGDATGRFRVSVPENWRQVAGANGVLRFVPDGAYATAGGQEVFTHGIELGVGEARSTDLREASEQLVQALAQGNPKLRAETRSVPVVFAGHDGLQLRLSNISDATGSPETVVLTTALLGDGRLAYSIGVAPAREIDAYADAFRRVNQSVSFGR